MVGDLEVAVEFGLGLDLISSGLGRWFILYEGWMDVSPPGCFSERFFISLN